MQPEVREKRILIGGAIAIVLMLAYLLWPSSSTPQSSVELVSADQRGAAGAGAPAGPPPPPTLVPTVAAAPPGATPPAAAAPGGIPQGMTLVGIAGSGAIFSMVDGSQRYIPRGREVAPGVTLQAVRLREVLLAAGTTNYRLGFGGTAVAVGPSAGGPVAAGPQPGMNGPPAELQRMAALRGETAQIQAGLTPRQVGSRVSGYYVRAVNSPAMQRAGIQPGDLILSVNGSELNAEALGDLAGTMQTSTRTEFELQRGGQRMRVALEPNR